MKRFDVAVIGGGNTGLTVANRVSAAGRSVVLIDRGPIGGLCSLAGCNPKKVFARAAEVLDEVRRASEHGIHVAEISVDWETVWRRKHSFTDPVPESTEQGLAAKGVARITGSAKFVSPDAVVVAGEEVRAEAFVIATGSTPRRLTFSGGELAQTTDDVLELRRPPERMAIIGAGVVAFEFAHVFARLGTRVTILMRTRRALARFDDDFAEHAVGFTKSLGVDFVPFADVTAVRRAGQGFRIAYTHPDGASTCDTDFVLNAAGRVPAISDLALTTAGVKTTGRGVAVDEFLRSTTNPRIFAGGDAHGILQLSPVASYDGRIIARNLLEGNVARADYATVPQAVYTTPPLATIGITATEARALGKDVEVATHDMSGWKVYAISGAPVAWARVVVLRGSGRILGAQLFGAGADDNIHLFALAMRHGVTSSELKEFVYAYPTFASTIQSVVP